MGSQLTKNELSEFSTSQVVKFLQDFDGGYFKQYTKEVYENKVNGNTLMFLMDEHEIDLFLLDMGVYHVKDRIKLLKILQSYAEHEGSMATLDSEALQLIPTTSQLRQKGENAGTLKGKGYTVLELLEGGYSLFVVLKLGYSSHELRDAGYVTSMKMSLTLDGGDVEGKYNGLWKDNYAEGEGICQYENGDTYEGFWIRGLRQGNGRETKSNGDMYEGEWFEGKKHGHGILTLNLDEKCRAGTYIGDFYFDDRHGKGKCTYRSG
jgi:hypothetical protein